MISLEYAIFADRQRTDLNRFSDCPAAVVAKTSGCRADQDQRNIAIARQRLAELKEQLQAGALTQALYDEQLDELEQALSDDLDIESHVKATSTQGRWMASVIVWRYLLSRVRFIGHWATISH